MELHHSATIIIAEVIHLLIYAALCRQTAGIRFAWRFFAVEARGVTGSGHEDGQDGSPRRADCRWRSIGARGGPAGMAPYNAARIRREMCSMRVFRRAAGLRFRVEKALSIRAEIT